MKPGTEMSIPLHQTARRFDSGIFLKEGSSTSEEEPVGYAHRDDYGDRALLVSVIFTPPVGLIAVLLTDPRTLDLLVAFFQLGNHCFELFFIRLEVA